MPRDVRPWLGLACALVLLASRPALADITVIGRYTFMNGDTATRASYFTSRRIRISTPDGREVIFDSKNHRISVIDHRRRVYWDGALARADSVVDVADGTRWDLMLMNASDQLKTEWASEMGFPAESIQVEDGFKTRMIAGYPCNRWTVRAGSFVTMERWMAASLAVDSYDQTTSDLVMTAILDPVARAVMSMFWQLEDTDEFCLGASLTLDTPMQRGTFRWEAVRVIGARIPPTAWMVPPDYARVHLVGELGAGDGRN
jgi:hypothetical protein